MIVWRRIQEQAKSEIPRHHEINSLTPAFIFCLDSKVKEPLVPLRMSGSFFDFVPSRIGHNVALDDAAACMSAIYRGTPSISYSADREIYQSYVKALASLRSFLNDSNLRLEAETLCASIMLQMCEVRITPTSVELYILTKPACCEYRQRGLGKPCKRHLVSFVFPRCTAIFKCFRASNA